MIFIKRVKQVGSAFKARKNFLRKKNLPRAHSSHVSRIRRDTHGFKKKKNFVHEIKINSVSRIYIDIFHEDQIKSKKSRKKKKENNTEILKFKVVSRFPLTSTSIINVFLDRT